MTICARAHLRIVETAEAAEALRDSWRALEAATPEATGFQSYDWCAAWMAATRSCGARTAFRIVVAEERGELVALLPLQIEAQLGARVARWLGEPLTQYGDALARPGEARADRLAAIFDELRGWRDVDLFAFSRLRADGVLRAAPFTGLAGERLAAPFVDLRAADASWRRRRKSLDRRERRFALGAPLRVEAAATAQERVEAARAALAAKRAWLRRKGFPSAGLSHRAVDAFFDRLAQEGALAAHRLCAGEATLAWDIGLVGGRAYRSLLGSYDAAFAAASPGEALTRRLAPLCAQAGFAHYDFLAPADAYKRRWGDGETPLASNFSPRSARGLAAAMLLAWARPLAKRLVRGVAGVLRRAPSLNFALQPPRRMAKAER